jgi:hypothetical protein
MRKRGIVPQESCGTIPLCLTGHARPWGLGCVDKRLSGGGRSGLLPDVVNVQHVDQEVIGQLANAVKDRRSVARTLRTPDKRGGDKSKTFLLNSLVTRPAKVSCSLLNTLK